MAHDAFISYSSKDKPVADAVCANLEANDIRCWIAPRDILPGQDWGEAIIDAINQSRVMVLVFSSSANTSPQIKREVERSVSKGIPIIPFRIEDVPLSKSLEYFISTPHWLDALTQPMEKHLQYLSQTVGMLLHRNEPRYVPSPTPAPPKNTSSSRNIILVAAGLSFGLLMFGLLAYFGFHLIQASLARNESNTVGSKSDSGIALKPESKIDPEVVGYWLSDVVIGGKNWNLMLALHPDETFKLKSSTEDSGTYSAQGGRWGVRSVKGEVDGGFYQVLNRGSVSMTGKLGTALWNRTGDSRSRSSRNPSIDPSLIGIWETDAVINAIPFHLVFEMAPNGTYSVVSTTEDGGTFEAKDGKCRQISRKNPAIDCTYQILSSDSISLTGPLGTAVWKRVSE
jgi:TIR domain